jgi:hypothetical protein
MVNYVESGSSVLSAAAVKCGDMSRVLVLCSPDQEVEDEGGRWFALAYRLYG